MSNPGPASTSTYNIVAPASNARVIETISVTLSPAAVGAATSAEQTFTGLSTGILAGDVILSITKPTAQAGIGIVGYRVDATTNDKFYITFMNATAGGVTPTASEAYLITVARLIAGTTGITTVSGI